MKTWKIEVTQDGSCLKIVRENEGFTLLELLGLLDVIRDDLIAQIENVAPIETVRRVVD